MEQGVVKVKKDKKITWKEVKRQKFLLVVSFFMVVYGIIFYYWPLTGWLMAFQNYKPKDGLLGSKFVGLAKFKFLFEDVTFLRVIRNTFCMGALNLVTCTFMAILFAILLMMILILYRLTTPRRPQHRVLPGAVFSAVAIVCMSILLSWLIGNSTKYSLVYGSLASVVILLFWFQAFGLLLIFGVLLNHALEVTAVQDP